MSEAIPPLTAEEEALFDALVQALAARLRSLTEGEEESS